MGVVASQVWRFGCPDNVTFAIRICNTWNQTKSIAVSIAHLILHVRNMLDEQLTHTRVHQPPRLHHVHRPCLGPLVQPVPIDALMLCCIGHWDPTVVVPLERNEPDVAVAHGRLPEEVDTVLVVDAVHLQLVGAESGKVVVWVHELMDALQAVDLVVNVQRAEKSIAIRDGDADVLPTEMLHVFRLDHDVFGCSVDIVGVSVLVSSVRNLFCLQFKRSCQAWSRSGPGLPAKEPFS